MKTFHNLKCKAFPHKRLYSSKGLVKNRKLSLAIPEEIQTASEKQTVTNCKRITIRRNIEEIKILIF